MSQINIETKRIENDHIIEATLVIDQSEYSNCIARFGDSKVVSTSQGSISDNEVVLPASAKKAFITLEYPYNQSNMDCVLSFLKGKELINSEAFSIPISRKQPISNLSDFQFLTVSTTATDHSSCLKQIRDKHTKSDWKARIKVSDDITVFFESTGTYRTLFAFGDESDGLVATDFVFEASQEYTKFVIPSEIFWKNRKRYTGKKLLVSELVKAESLPLNNYFFKVPISNTLPLSDFPRHISPTDMVSPTGEPLDPDLFQVDPDYLLPVYKT